MKITEVFKENSKALTQLVDEYLKVVLITEKNKKQYIEKKKNV